MKSTWRAIPILLLWLDMAYGFVLNLISSLSLRGGNLPKEGLPVAPEFAFSWLQVLANGGMVLVVGWGLWLLLRLNRSVTQGQVWPLGVMRILGLMTALAFSLPAWWHWLWALVDFLQGQAVVAWHNPRYLAVAVLMPYPAALCLWCLYQRQQNKRIAQP